MGISFKMLKIIFCLCIGALTHALPKPHTSILQIQEQPNEIRTIPSKFPKKISKGIFRGAIKGLKKCSSENDIDYCPLPGNIDPQSE